MAIGRSRGCATSCHIVPHVRTESTEVRGTVEQLIPRIKTLVGHGQKRKQLTDAHAQTAGRHSRRLTQVLYASPPADLPLATEFARPSLTIMVPSLSTCAHASLNC